MPFRESAGSSLSTHRVAAVAQSVERYLGKVEVGGSIPLGSLLKKVRNIRTFLFYSGFLIGEAFFVHFLEL